ncbi:hypothetical protein K402DRAFT_358269, partial [Aulographum hederae CBS 113979]
MAQMQQRAREIRDAQAKISQLANQNRGDSVSDIKEEDLDAEEEDRWMRATYESLKSHYEEKKAKGMCSVIEDIEFIRVKNKEEARRLKYEQDCILSRDDYTSRASTMGTGEIDEEDEEEEEVEYPGDEETDEEEDGDDDD